jgi:hypothetical protein
MLAPMTKATLAIVIGALVAACGSSTGSSSDGMFTTSVTATAKLSDLTNAQQNQLCSDLHTFNASTVYKNAIEGGCRLAGIIIASISNPQSDAAAQKACMDAYNSCKADPLATNLLSATNFACYSSSTGCKATVGEFAACLNDVYAALSTDLAALPVCSMITRGGLTGDAGFPVSLAQSASCTTFVTNCPEAQR